MTKKSEDSENKNLVKDKEKITKKAPAKKATTSKKPLSGVKLKPKTTKKEVNKSTDAGSENTLPVVDEKKEEEMVLSPVVEPKVVVEETTEVQESKDTDPIESIEDEEIIVESEEPEKEDELESDFEDEDFEDDDYDFGDFDDEEEEGKTDDEPLYPDDPDEDLDEITEEPIPVVEPVVETVVEPVVETVVESVVEPVVKPVVEPVVKPVPVTPIISPVEDIIKEEPDISTKHNSTPVTLKIDKIKTHTPVMEFEEPVEEEIISEPLTPPTMPQKEVEPTRVENITPKNLEPQKASQTPSETNKIPEEKTPEVMSVEDLLGGIEAINSRPKVQETKSVEDLLGGFEPVNSQPTEVESPPELEPTIHREHTKENISFAELEPENDAQVDEIVEEKPKKKVKKEKEKKEKPPKPEKPKKEKKEKPSKKVKDEDEDGDDEEKKKFPILLVAIPVGITVLVIVGCLIFKLVSSKNTTEVVESIPAEQVTEVAQNETVVEPEIEQEVTKEVTHTIIEDRVLAEASDSDRNPALISLFNIGNTPIFALQDTLSIVNKATGEDSTARSELTEALDYTNKDSKYYADYHYPASVKVSTKWYINNKLNKQVSVAELGSQDVTFLDISAKTLSSLDTQLAQEMGLETLDFLKTTEEYKGIDVESYLGDGNDSFTVTAISIEAPGYNRVTKDNKKYLYGELENSEYRELTDSIDLFRLDFGDLNLYIYANREGLTEDKVQEYLKSLTAETLVDELSNLGDEDIYKYKYSKAEFYVPEIDESVVDTNYQSTLAKLGVQDIYNQSTDAFKDLIINQEELSKLSIKQSTLLYKLHIYADPNATKTSLNDGSTEVGLLPIKRLAADSNSVYILTDKENNILSVGKIK